MLAKEIWLAIKCEIFALTRISWIYDMARDEEHALSGDAVTCVVNSLQYLHVIFRQK